jgi:hypothetical protein
MAPLQKSTGPSNIPAKATGSQKDLVSNLHAINTSLSANVASVSSKRVPNQAPAHQGVSEGADGMEKLTLTSDASLHHSTNESTTDCMQVAQGTDDDRSHLSGSSAKPASFDTKSMASENTFAMDEKESLRPDDSASVQAADEDEPIFGPPVPGRPDGQVSLDGSNSGSRGPLHDAPISVGAVARRFPMSIMANPPRFGDILPHVPPSLPQNGTPLHSFPTNPDGVEPPQQYPASPPPPDEKIIEAMGTPKDRLLLLQLEEKFLAFITQSRYARCGNDALSSRLPLCRDAMLDLPPQNSYERLLAHKLADYYNLAHYNPGDTNSIRLYKTAELRLYVTSGTYPRSC